MLLRGSLARPGEPAPCRWAAPALHAGRPQPIAPDETKPREPAAQPPPGAAPASAATIRPGRGELCRAACVPPSPPTRPPAPPLPPVSGRCCPSRLSQERGPLGRSCPAASFLIQELPPPLPLEPVDLRGFCGREACRASELVSYPQRKRGCVLHSKGCVERLSAVCDITMVLIRAEDA